MCVCVCVWLWCPEGGNTPGCSRVGAGAVGLRQLSSFRASLSTTGCCSCVCLCVSVAQVASACVSVGQYWCPKWGGNNRAESDELDSGERYHM